MISMMSEMSGTIIDIGRRSAFKFSGSSERPAYPGFIVTKMPQVPSNLISFPSNQNRLLFCVIAVRMHKICCATTESTSTSMRLNSSKHDHAPVCASPENIRPRLL